MFLRRLGVNCQPTIPKVSPDVVGSWRCRRWLTATCGRWATRSERDGLCENLGMIVRPAAAPDADEIASLLNAHLATTTIEWTEKPQTAVSILEWLDEHETVLVADEQGEVVGVAAFGWFRDVVKRPGYRFTVEDTIHVREDKWGSGVGRDLMRALAEKARESGKHTMVAAIDGANESSIRFHKQLGFVEVGRMPEIGAKFGRWCDLVLLQLRLDDGTAPRSD
jgi:L-amino acid N-acyltransferase